MQVTLSQETLMEKSIHYPVKYLILPLFFSSSISGRVIRLSFYFIIIYLDHEPDALRCFSLYFFCHIPSCLWYLFFSLSRSSSPMFIDSLLFVCVSPSTTKDAFNILFFLFVSQHESIAKKRRRSGWMRIRSSRRDFSFFSFSFLSRFFLPIKRSLF